MGQPRLKCQFRQEKVHHRTVLKTNEHYYTIEKNFTGIHLQRFTEQAGANNSLNGEPRREGCGGAKIEMVNHAVVNCSLRRLIDFLVEEKLLLVRYNIF